MTASVPRLCLVSGDDDFLAERAVAGVIAAARATDSTTEVRQFAAAELAAAEWDELVSPSLFGGGRVLVLHGGHDAKKDLIAAVLGYAAAADPELCLVVVHAGGVKGKAFADSLRAAGAQVVTAAKIGRHRERVEFVREEIRRLGGSCTDEAAEALIAAVGNDLRELAAAASQLVSDIVGRIDAALVARYYRGRAEVSGFTVADAAMVGDVPAAMEALRWALHIGVDPVPIADALADGVRTVARVATAGRGNPYQLAASLSLAPWKVERAQRQAKGWTAEGLADAVRATALCNADVKGGAEDREYALERTILAVVAARARGDGR